MLAALRDKPGEFALLLTDYNMPGMSGLEVAREALALDPRLTVAVASGHITDGETLSFGDAGLTVDLAIVAADARYR